MCEVLGREGHPVVSMAFLPWLDSRLHNSSAIGSFDVSDTDFRVPIPIKGSFFAISLVMKEL